MAAKSAPQEDLAAKAKLLASEGLDFIENEGDVVAVESAALKIQSTFRGKKIRSKLTEKKANSDSKPRNEKCDKKQQSCEEDKLCARVEKMQCADKADDKQPSDESQSNPPASQSPDAIEKAAAKIQAGFKGYKTRKELEARLAGSQPKSGSR